MTAFDPVYTVGEQIVETLVRHQQMSREQARQRALELFELVHIPSPARRLKSYPHEMSGGMRQRGLDHGVGHFWPLSITRQRHLLV